MKHHQPVLRISVADASAVLVHGSVRYTVSIETFDAARAAEALGHNTCNRPLSPFQARQLAASISRREWKLNGETVVFSDSGRLLQGQHRMQAVILTGVPITTFVVRGVPDDVFPSFDRGKKRGAADVLAIDGKKNTVQLAAAGRAIVFLEQGGYAGRNCSSDQVRATVEQHPTLSTWVERFSTSPARKFLPSSFAAVLTLAAERHGEAPVGVFLEQVASGEQLAKRMPAFTLRERFLGAARGQSLTAEVQLAFFIKAINAHLRAEPLVMLRFLPGEDFPSVCGRHRASGVPA